MPHHHYYFLEIRCHTSHNVFFTDLHLAISVISFHNTRHSCLESKIYCHFLKTELLSSLLVYESVLPIISVSRPQIYVQITTATVTVQLISFVVGATSSRVSWKRVLESRCPHEPRSLFRTNMLTMLYMSIIYGADFAPPPLHEQIYPLCRCVRNVMKYNYTFCCMKLQLIECQMK